MSHVLIDERVLTWGRIGLGDMLRIIQIAEENAWAAGLPATTLAAAIYGSTQLLLVGSITDPVFVHGGIRPNNVNEAMLQCGIRYRPAVRNRLPAFVNQEILPQTPDSRIIRRVRSRIRA